MFSQLFNKNFINKYVTGIIDRLSSVSCVETVLVNIWERIKHCQLCQLTSHSKWTTTGMSRQFVRPPIISLCWAAIMIAAVLFLPRCIECRAVYRQEKAVCPSVKRVHCDKTEERSVHIFRPYKRSFSLVFWEEKWLVGATPSTCICRRRWQLYAAHASTSYVSCA